LLQIVVVFVVEFAQDLGFVIDGDTLAEQPFDLQGCLAVFEEVDQQFQDDGSACGTEFLLRIRCT
jgi:hypothetical protein